ncbi:hypothetical protein BC940DRAFT_291177 [Gongronella butleri]|nr:hypothetical protein BC940DRAFT_291177 [Gongronella butleri]
MPTGFYLTQEKKTEIKNLLRQGMTRPAVAKVCGVRVNTVRTVDRHPELPARRPSRPMIKHEIYQVKQQLQDGLSVQDMAQLMGRDYEEIEAIRKKYGIVVGRHYKGGIMPPKMRDEVKRQLLADTPVSQIASALGVSQHSVHMVRDACNIPSPNLSPEDAARAVHPNTIAMIREMYNIPVPGLMTPIPVPAATRDNIKRLIAAGLPRFQVRLAVKVSPSFLANFCKANNLPSPKQSCAFLPGGRTCQKRVKIPQKRGPRPRTLDSTVSKKSGTRATSDDHATASSSRQITFLDEIPMVVLL